MNYLQRLIKLVSGLLSDDIRDRRSRILLWMFDAPNVGDRLNNISLSGDRMTAAMSLIMGLKGYDDTPLRYQPGRAYLLDLVVGLKQMETQSLDIADVQFLEQVAEHLGNIISKADNVAANLPFSPPPVPGGIPDNIVVGDARMYNEKIIGENTLRPIYYLQLALDASRAVCRLTQPEGPNIKAGTGFLVSPQLIMTNKHVVGSEAQRTNTTIEFLYEKTAAGSELVTVTAKPKPDGLFHIDSNLDVALFEVTQESATHLSQREIRPLTLSTKNVKVGDRVSIIQHPRGDFKQISFQNNRVQYAGPNPYIDYTTTTLPGSSGSPVFDDNFRVVALHRAGGELKTAGSGMYYYFNRGSAMSAILGFLRGNHVDGLAVSDE